MDIILATNNQAKLTETRDILSGLPVRLLSLQDVGIKSNPEESGTTLLENARIKARSVFTIKKAWIIADDTGFFIEGLDGQPGVFSARWAGKHATKKQIQEFTLQQTATLVGRQRNAYFQTTLVLLSPDGDEWEFDGRVSGKITESIRGESSDGVPYDSLFIPSGRKKTFAEMDKDDKNRISHRAAAYHELRSFLMELF